MQVRGEDENPFDQIVSQAKRRARVDTDSDLTESDWQAVCEEFKDLIKRKSGKKIPKEPAKQLIHAIEAVFSSWNNPRARTYRKLNNIDEKMGTAVIIQQMVFGNRNDNSASGVAFTRDPGNGKKRVFGEYLVKAQGEDVVAGTRTPEKLGRN